MIVRLALALGMLVAPQAQAADPGVIMYARGGTIYIAAPDGSGERAYAQGSAPALARGGGEVAYSVRAGNAFQVVVAGLTSKDAPRQVTSFPDREAEFGPQRHGAVGAAWSPGRTWLALRVMEGSTTTLAVVRPDGSGYHRFEYGHLFGSTIAWRDESTLAVGTDGGLRLVNVNGTESALPGGANGDTPATWLDAGRLVVNDTGGASVIENGTRRRLLANATAWDAGARGVLWTTDTEIGFVDPATAGSTPYERLPGGGQVTYATAARPLVLVEYARADGTSAILTVAGQVVGVGLGAFARPARARTVTQVATGEGLTLNDTVPVADVVPAGASPEDPAGTATPRPPDGTAIPGNPVTDPHGAGRTVFSAGVPTAREVDTGLAALLGSLLVTALLMLLITFPSELFNNTLEAHYDEVRGWFRLPPRGDPVERPRARRLAAFGAFVLAAGVLNTLLDPDAAFDGPTARLFLGVVVGMVVVTLLFGAAKVAFHRRRGARGALHALPGSLAVAAVCVLVTRLTGFRPGYLYGVLAGFAFAGALSEADRGRAELVAAGWVVVASVAAWLLWLPVDTAAGRGDPSVLLGLADTTLSAIAVGGIQGLVIGLLPLRSLPGHTLSRWSRPAWAGTYALVLFAFVHVLLRHGGGDGDTRPDVMLWAVLFVAFGFVSVAFWAYFRNRPVSSG